MINRIINNYKQYGFWIGSKRMFLKILKPLFSIETLHILECKCDSTILGSNFNNDVKITKIGYEDIKSLLGEGIISLYKKNLFEKRLNEGCYIGHIIKCRNKTAGFGWIQINGTYKTSVGYEYNIPEDSAVMLDLFICAMFRNRGLAGKWMKFGKNETVRLRLKNIIVFVYKDNIPSLKLCQNNGFYLSEIVTYKRIGTKVIMSRKNV